MYGSDYRPLPEDYWIGESQGCSPEQMRIVRARTLEIKLMHEAAVEERIAAEKQVKIRQGQLDNQRKTLDAIQEAVRHIPGPTLIEQVYHLLAMKDQDKLPANSAGQLVSIE